MVDLYFLGSETLDKKDQFRELWKRAFDEMKTLAEVDLGEKTCNYVHPEAKFIFKINTHLRNVRFFLRK